MLLEHGIEYTRKVVEVWSSQPELNEKNILGRVPTLVLKDGTVLID